MGGAVAWRILVGSTNTGEYPSEIKDFGVYGG